MAKPLTKDKTKRRGHWARAARALGVSQPHLWLVVHGQRVSHKLMKRYTALLKQEGWE